MSKSVTLEIPEAEAVHLEAVLDEVLTALRRVDEVHEPRQERLERLRAETRVLMEQIKAELDVEETL